MENPRLTFATPTVLAGDKSLVSLVAHELSHSWSGNLVTNGTWRDFWLNEGFTVYCEQRIMERLYGPERATMERQLARQDLEKEMRELEPWQQVLHADLRGRHPDDYFSSVPYMKGALFLRRVEAVFGRERFDQFLRGWFDGHAFQSVTTADFVRYLRSNLLDQHPDVMTDAELDDWLYGPGIPVGAQRAVSPRLAALDARRVAWLKGEAKTADLGTNWNAAEWMKFLNDVDNQASRAQLQELDRAFRLSSTGNSEVAFRFYRAAVHAGDRDVRPQLQAFLLSVGRQKFVVPLYAALHAQPEDKAWADEVYRKARAHYHPETQASVDRELAK
jgi:aminopeptidase N